MHTSSLSTAYIEHAVRVGFALLDPRLDGWSYGKNRRIILAGRRCCSSTGSVRWPRRPNGCGRCGARFASYYTEAPFVWEKMGTFSVQHVSEKPRVVTKKTRIPRTSQILDCSKSLGVLLQEMRTHDTHRMLPGTNFTFRVRS
jgi:hypothetical protein